MIDIFYNERVGNAVKNSSNVEIQNKKNEVLSWFNKVFELKNNQD